MSIEDLYGDGPDEPLEPAGALSARNRALLVAAGLLVVLGLTATAVALNGSGEDGSGRQEGLVSTPSPTAADEVSAEPTPSEAPSPTATPSPTLSPSVTPTPSASPTATARPTTVAPTTRPSRTPSASPAASPTPTRTPSPTPSPTPVVKTATVLVTNSASEDVRLVVNDVSEVTIAEGTTSTVVVVVRGDDNDSVFLSSTSTDCGPPEQTGGFGLQPGHRYEVTVVDSAAEDCITGPGTTTTRPVFASGPPWQDIT